MNKLFGILIFVLFGASWAYAKPPLGIQGNVTVTNTPLPVVLDTPVRIPVQVRGDGSNCTSICQAIVYEVPEGKRLVIEYVSADTRITLGGQSGADTPVFIFTQFGGQSQKISVGATSNSGPGSNSFDTLASPVKIYAESETVVICGIETPNFEKSWFLHCFITGYLEDES